MTRAPTWLMRRFWDAHSRGWEQIASAGWAGERRKQLVDVTCSLVPAGARVVDLGCGAGHLAAELAQRGLEVTAVDYSAAMLERAKRRAAELGVEVALARLDLDGDFPWAPGAFDLAVSVNVLQVLRDPRAFLAKMAQLVGGDGKLILEAPGGASDRASLPDMRLPDRVLNEAKRVAARLPGGVTWYDTDVLGRLADGIGLSIVSLTTVGSAPRLIAQGLDVMVG